MRFQFSDVFLPSSGVVFPPVEERSELEGTIIGFSDSGSQSRAFAVIEVVRRQSLIVPVEKLEVIKAPTLESET